jgi:trimethylguanosine synthase
VRVRVDPPIRAERGEAFFEPSESRRRRIFSRWDEGIRADEEGLYSATPEALAMWMTRDAVGVVMDGTTGIGSIAIALARQPHVREVIAVDVDADRLAMAAHNAKLYGVSDKIRFVRGDVVDALRMHRVDSLILDPPWGGPDYDRTRTGLDDLPMNVRRVMDVSPPALVLKLPRSFDPSTLPSTFTFEAAVDSRGVVKFVVATRRGDSAGRSSRP